MAYEGKHLKSARCIRALCRAEAEAIRNLGLMNPICVIPNCVELEAGEEEPFNSPVCDSGSRCEPGSAARGLEDAQKTVHRFRERLNNRKVLLYLGRLLPKKG